MRESLLILGVIVGVVMQTYSQVNYNGIRLKRLHPITIDTLKEATLIIEKRNATLIFRQSDIENHLKRIDSTGSKYEPPHHKLLDLLDDHKAKIRLTDWSYDYTDEERLKLFGNKNYSDADQEYLSELYFLGADMILAGKFMVISKPSRAVVTKGLKAKRIKGLFGSRSVVFRLPNNKPFWNIVTQYGE